MHEKICSICKKSKPKELFFKSSRMKDGLQSACKECSNNQQKNSRAKKTDHYISVRKNHRQQLIKQMREWKTSKGCYFCEEDFGPCLELHHVNDDKNCNPSDSINKSFESFIKEASKCVVLCSNCHRKVHHNLLII